MKKKPACPVCGKTLAVKRTGRPPVYCSTECRNLVSLANRLGKKIVPA